MKDEKYYGLVKGNPLKWIQFKGWFFLDLPQYIKQNNFTKGVELGAKGGRSMYYMLRKNPDLNLVGIDLWESINAGAYLRNDKNYDKCLKKLKPFKNRVELQKGDASVIADNFKDKEFDFIHYDLQTASLNTVESHYRILSQWVKKVRNGGVIVGRDFRNSEIRLALNELGFKEHNIQPCTLKIRNSVKFNRLNFKN